MFHKTVVDVLRGERKGNKPWVKNDILDLCNMKMGFRKTSKVDPEAAKLHSEVSVKIRNKIKEVTDNWITRQCDNIESGMRE